MERFNQAKQVAAALKAKIAPRCPKIGVVLGSGLGAFAETLSERVALDYANIDQMPQSSVSGHQGCFVAGQCGPTQVLVMQGRVHLYEGHAIDKVALGVRAMIEAGCQTLILTNAAGGIADPLSPGDLVLLSDHINLMGQNPLIGTNDESVGQRFVDMSETYSAELRMLTQEKAKTHAIPLSEGVYAGVMGPSYETPAEVRMLRAMGADLVGMSTVPEAIAARHMGAAVLGISCVTNKAAGLGGLVSHDEVKQTADRVKDQFVTLLQAVIVAIGERYAE